MEKIKTALKSPVTYVVLAVGIVLAVAYASKLPSFVKKVAGYLPGSDTKAA